MLTSAGHDWCPPESPRGNGPRANDGAERLKWTETGARAATATAPGQRGEDAAIIQRLRFDNL